MSKQSDAKEERRRLRNNGSNIEEKGLLKKFGANIMIGAANFALGVTLAGYTFYKTLLNPREVRPYIVEMDLNNDGIKDFFVEEHYFFGPLYLKRAYIDWSVRREGDHLVLLTREILNVNSDKYRRILNQIQANQAEIRKRENLVPKNFRQF